MPKASLVYMYSKRLLAFTLTHPFAFRFRPTHKTMPPKRRHDETDATVQELKRHKSAVDDAIAELVCPITQSLPVDPVIVEDGNVYKRSGLELQMSAQHARCFAVGHAHRGQLQASVVCTVVCAYLPCCAPCRTSRSRTARCPCGWPRAR